MLTFGCGLPAGGLPRHGENIHCVQRRPQHQKHPQPVSPPSGHHLHSHGKVSGSDYSGRCWTCSWRWDLKEDEVEVCLCLCAISMASVLLYVRLTCLMMMCFCRGTRGYGNPRRWGKRGTSPTARQSPQEWLSIKVAVTCPMLRCF